ncbi:MAG TPA: trimeric intracellular cation channel family protein [Nitratifractor sp.]|nr:trimeric intracellular cation channel family protein [Nitratifractor sp.]HHD74639.1 trimeric intracellular cation channel family protein [Nitratifractor sp.]
MFEIADYIGIAAFATSGFLVALRNRLDLLGIFVSLFLTALGGGIVRDIILQQTPYSFTHNAPALILITIMVILTLFRIQNHNALEGNPVFIISDSIGLVSFSISGAILAIEHNFNFTGVLALSFITAVGGGIARDIIINEVPLVFKSGFYGTISLLVGLIIIALDYLQAVNIFTLATLFLSATLLRIIAYYKKWSVPTL